MSVDIATVGIRMETEGVKRGEQQVTQSFENVGASAEKMEKRVSTASAGVVRANDGSAVSVQRLKAMVDSMGMSAEDSARTLKALGVSEEQLATTTSQSADKIEAALRKRAAAEQQAYQEAAKRESAARRMALAEVAAYEENARRSNVVRQASQAILAAEAAGYAENTNRVRASTQAKANAEAGAKKLSQALQTVAITAAGIPGPIGRVTSVLSSMAVGGVVTVGVVAGIAAITAAWDAYTRDAREAKARTDELIASLNKARDARLGNDVGQSFGDLELARRRAQGNVTRQLAGNVTTDARTGISTRTFSESGLSAAYAQLSQVRRAIDQLSQQEYDKVKKQGEEAAAQAKQRASEVASAANKARTIAEERARQIDAIRKVEDDLNLILAERLGYDDQRLARQAALRNALEAQLATMDRLTQAEKERLRATGESLIAEQIGITQARANAVTAGFAPRMIGRDGRPVVGAGLAVPRNQIIDADDAINEGQRAATAVAQAWDEAARQIQRSLTSGIEAVLTGADGWGQQLAKTFAASFSAVLAAQLQDALKNSPAWHLFEEGLKSGRGGLTGFIGQRDATVVSAAAGAGIGYASGDAGRGFVGGAGAGYALAGVPGAVVGSITGMVAGLFSAGDRAEEAARRFEKARQEFQKTLDAYVAEATGTATALSRALDQNRAEADRLRKGVIPDYKGDPYYGKTIGQIDAAEAEAERRLRERDASRQRISAINLAEREARLAGNEPGVLVARATAEKMALDQQVAAGEMTIDLASRTAAVIDAELNAALQRLADDAAKAAKKIDDDLRIRGIRAEAGLAEPGSAREAVEKRLREEERRIEIEQALASGYNETQLAALKRVHAMEEEIIATEQAKKAEDELAATRKAQLNLMADLKERELRATGQGAAADEYSIRRRYQDELESASKLGTEYVMEVLRVQALENADRDRQRRQAQQDAYDSAIAASAADSYLPDSRTSVNLAVGTSEATGNRIAGLLTSQLSYQSSLPRIEQVLRETKAIISALRSAPLTPDQIRQVDRDLAVLGAQADSAFGNLTSNR